MKKVLLTLGLALTMASCTMTLTSPDTEISAMETINPVYQLKPEGQLSIEVYRVKLDGKHDYLIASWSEAKNGVCHDPECAYCKMNPSTGKTSSNSSDDWTW